MRRQTRGQIRRQIRTIAKFAYAHHFCRGTDPLGTLRCTNCLCSMYGRWGKRSSSRTGSPEDGQIGTPARRSGAGQGAGHGASPLSPQAAAPVPGGNLCEAVNCVWLAGLPSQVTFLLFFMVSSCC